MNQNKTTGRQPYCTPMTETIRVNLEQDLLSASLVNLIETFSAVNEPEGYNIDNEVFEW